MSRGYGEFFMLATGENVAPYPYQSRIAESPQWPVIARIPTGMGKTAATVLAWLWRRLELGEGPRRLVYVLPQRALVEQTVNRIEQWCSNLRSAGHETPSVHKLLGGEVAREWIGDAENPQILVGTQDLLLSRALNRGYAMPRRLWPMAAGLLNNDALWVIDEVQLHGIGAVTAAQLQGLRGGVGAYGSTAAVFVSATIDPRWIDTADHPLQDKPVITLEQDDLALPSVSALLHARKKLSRLDCYEPDDIAEVIAARHQPGTVTLVVLNRVSRAVNVYKSLKKRSGARFVLLHSRFRDNDRRALQQRLDGSQRDPGEEGTVVVATQVVEAGLDVSSRLLVTDLAPWPSMIQRFGRCNRRAEHVAADVYWSDPGEIARKNALPYELSELESARARLLALEGASVSPATFSGEESLPFPSGSVLRRSFLFDLFDTSPDLSGNDLDVAPFIRPEADHSVFVFWRNEPPDEKHPPRRQELCPAPILEVEKLVVQHGNKLARTVDPLVRGGWRQAPKSLRIGETVWLHSSLGGYSGEIGFEKDLKIDVPEIAIAEEIVAECETDGIGDDALSEGRQILTLEAHSTDTVREATRMLADLADVLSPGEREAVITAARWHDRGKAHEVFQSTMRRAGCPANGAVWAKAPGRARHSRRHFRHELASALGWLAASSQDHNHDLIAYLIAAHHGIVRASVHHIAADEDDDGVTILGVKHEEEVAAATLGGGTEAPAFRANLALFNVGGNVSTDGEVEASWTDRTCRLLSEPDLGPFRLLFLEGLVRMADWRASANPSVGQDA